MVTLAPTLIIVLFSKLELSLEHSDNVLDQPGWVSFTMAHSVEFDLGSGGTFFLRTSKHCLLEKALNTKIKLKKRREKKNDIKPSALYYGEETPQYRPEDELSRIGLV
jgi:hypothetical protein